MSTQLPIAIIGAGPIGLAAAAHLLKRQETPLVFEVGASVGASILEWGHVRLFTPWHYATDSVAAALLAQHGWTAPEPDSYPTGAELVEQYLQPLARLPELQPHIQLDSRVIRVARQGYDKMKTPGREKAPFVVTVQTADGDEVQYLAKAVIDASGNWRSPNPLGGSGIPALGEEALKDHISYGIPAILGEHRARFANKTVLVAGSGASAFNVLLDLVRLVEQAPQTKVLWVICRALSTRLFGGGELDELPARGALGQRVRELVERGVFQVVSEFKVTRLRRVGSQLEVSSADHTLAPIDEIIVTTGFRPDLSPLSELRLALDPAVESPLALAEMIDPNVHSCGSVPPHGAEELKQPEPNFYIVGSKSYGRAPTFLLLTGYEQARSVVAAIAGDWAAAREVQLVLPQTGVCSASPDDPLAGACCGTSAAVKPETDLIPLTAIPVSDAGTGSCCGALTSATAIAVSDIPVSNSGGCCG